MSMNQSTEENAEKKKNISYIPACNTDWWWFIEMAQQCNGVIYVVLYRAGLL
jgi:hypothetical protein